MKSNLEAVLDRLEVLCTKPNKRWKEKQPPDWAVWMSPDLSLRPDDPYRRTLYVRAVSTHLLITLPFYFAAIGIGVAVGWSSLKKIYVFLNAPHPTGQAHAFVILTRDLVLFLAVAFPLVLAAIPLAGLFPRYYFWNRRARRLRSQEAVPELVPAEILMDPAVWPPPPKRPA